jgi:hypothetical protein
VFCICRDVTEQKRAEKEREELIGELKDALAEVKALRGILPLCSYCKRIRDDEGYWQQVDVYIRRHSQAEISHSICPECLERYFPGTRKSNAESGSSNGPATDAPPDGAATSPGRRMP